MKKSNVKGIVICLVSLIVLVLVTINVFGTKTYAATSVNDILNSMSNTAPDQIQDDPNDITEENTNTNKNSNTNTNANANNNTNSNANNNTNNNSNANNNTNTGIPYTGVDNSVIFVIVAFGISALIAYKKIRDYKNI